MATTSTFTRVTTADYYGRYDSVGGRFQAEGDLWPVRNGMRIKVKWRGGRVTTERLVIRTGYGSEQIDMNGYPDHFQTRDFVVVRNVHGTKVDVPLRGLSIAPIRRLTRKGR